MPRNKERKTVRERASEEAINAAIKAVLTENMSIRAASEKFSISKSKLSRHVCEAKKKEEAFVLTPRTVPNKVFSQKQEVELVEYLIMASKMHHGLTPLETRKLAFQFAVAIGLKIPENWHVDDKAGRDWLYGFMQRNKSLSIRKPEATSLARSTSFNKFNVDKFYSNVAEVLQKYNFEPQRIFNCDETGCSTVPKPPNIISKKGMKQIGQVTSAEKGKTVTICCFINATGNTIPPAFVFPRATSSNFLIIGAPSGSLSLVHKSGWMTAENFLKVLEHFVKHTNSTKENPVLLTLDNHESHVNIEAIKFAKEHGVVMVTFPPHCSHKLQPLDLSVYGPFKKYYNSALNHWMLNNPGQAITYYHVPGIVNEAFTLSMTPKNILAGFSKSGIFPFNANNFTEMDFLSSYVSDRPEPAATSEVDILKLSMNDTSLTTVYAHSSVASSSPPFTPESVRPFPKAPPRKFDTKRGRKKGATRILTKTPEKAVDNNTKLVQKKILIMPKLKSNKRKRISFSESSESSFVLSDSSSNEDFSESFDVEENVPLQQISENDFVLVKCEGKSSIYHYVALVVEINHGIQELFLNFLRKRCDSQKFVYPEREEKYWTENKDIVKKLPQPTIDQKTIRSSTLMSFDFDFSNFNMK